VSSIVATGLVKEPIDIVVKNTEGGFQIVENTGRRADSLRMAWLDPTVTIWDHF